MTPKRAPPLPSWPDRAKLLRPKGAGTVARDGDLWRARLPGTRRTIGRYGSAELARAALEDRGFGMPARDFTVGSWLLHFASVRAARGLRNLEGNASLTRAHFLADEIAVLPIASLDAAALRAWLRRMQSKDVSGNHWPRRALSPKVVKNALTLLRSALAHALSLGLVHENVAAAVVLPRSASRARTTRARFDGILTVGEQRALLSRLPLSWPFGRMVRVAMGLGLRLGELLSLRWDDVHARDVEPWIAVRYGGERQPCKGGKPRRLPLFGMALEAVQAESGEGVYVFGLRGERRKDAPRGVFDRVLQEAGIARAIRWHDLRHTCATSLLLGWWGRPWSVAEVQALLGHASPRMTESYLHTQNEIVFTAAAATSGPEREGEDGGT